MKFKAQWAIGALALLAASQAFAQITFYEGEGYRGRAFAANNEIRNLQEYGFNDRASSVVVEHGRWEVCEDAGFRGHCVVLRKGSYDSLRGLGMQRRISSLRPVEDRHYENEAPEPMAAPDYEYRRRPEETLYEAPVISAHAVVGPPNQRCWVEREQVNAPSQPNVGGAVAGALIGGILGHQVGNGRGRDVATIGGAAGGAYIGSNVGRTDGTTEQDVRRCDSVPSTTPAYWDVVYNFRGVDHRIQLNAQPSRTILVNEAGDPRQ